MPPPPTPSPEPPIAVKCTPTAPGLPHFNWTWKLTRGELRDEALKFDIITAIEAHITGKGEPPLYPV